MIDFLQDIYDGMKTFMVGMKVTGGYLKENMIREGLLQAKTDINMAPNTVEYDGTIEKALLVPVADRFRGHLHNDVERCIVCKNCAKACPIDCFWIDGEKTEHNKLRPSRFDIDILKCMYCGLCVVACPTGCLTMTKEWWGSQRANTTDTHGGRSNLHGLIREFGVGFYTPEQKVEVEKKRIEIAEAKKRKAAEDAAKKAAAAAAAKAAAPKPAAPAAGASPTANAAPKPDAPAPAAPPKTAEGGATPGGGTPNPAST
ncbi:MAG: 4Fe-4S binding protein [Planctomycetes bacterium]|nr:4Fe-4S binding protein [Planctomycetota bacterium]